MAFAFGPVMAVDSAVEHWPITLVAAAILWISLRELGPVDRLRRWLG